MRNALMVCSLRPGLQQAHRYTAAVATTPWLVVEEGHPLLAEPLPDAGKVPTASPLHSRRHFSVQDKQKDQHQFFQTESRRLKTITLCGSQPGPVRSRHYPLWHEKVHKYFGERGVQW